MALEYCPNGDLKAFLKSKKGKSLGDGDRTDIAMQIASGMAVIHGAGIAHLDLKVRGLCWSMWRRVLGCMRMSLKSTSFSLSCLPNQQTANILVDADKRMKIADFGISRLCDPSGRVAANDATVVSEFGGSGSSGVGSGGPSLGGQG